MTSMIKMTGIRLYLKYYSTTFILLLFCAWVSCTTNSSPNKPNVLKKQEISGSKDTLEKWYFKSGYIAEIHYELDSFDVITNTQYTRSVYTYYENGNVKEKGFQGTYNGMGVAVGTWEKFSLKGELELKTHFHNDTFGQDYILFEHIKKGKVIKTEKYHNDMQYETDRGRKLD